MLVHRTLCIRRYQTVAFSYLSYTTIMFSSVKSDIGVNKTEDNAFRQIIIPSLTLTDEGFNDDGV